MRHLLNFVALIAISFVSVLVLSHICIATPGPYNMNEKFSLHAMRQLHSAEMTYASTTGNGHFGTAADLGRANLIDGMLATGSKYGYEFAVLITASSANIRENFVINATPRMYPKTGRMSFFIDPAGEIYGGDKGGGPASIGDRFIDDCTNGSIIDNERCSILSLRALFAAEVTYLEIGGTGSVLERSPSEPGERWGTRASAIGRAPVGIDKHHQRRASHLWQESLV